MVFCRLSGQWFRVHCFAGQFSDEVFGFRDIAFVFNCGLVVSGRHVLADPAGLSHPRHPKTQNHLAPNSRP